jgi:competence protein ComFB
MSLRDRVDFEVLQNEAERLVIDELDRQLAEAGPEVCRTEDCIIDMAAFALNNVSPLYRANLLGRLYAQNVEDEYARSIREAVSRAIRRISENPS